eukprot:1153066-Pelagomonas_calceolata.AAC.3
MAGGAEEIRQQKGREKAWCNKRREGEKRPGMAGGKRQEKGRGKGLVERKEKGRGKAETKA